MFWLAEKWGVPAAAKVLRCKLETALSAFNYLKSFGMLKTIAEIVLL
jgi:hypothetical protein